MSSEVIRPNDFSFRRDILRRTVLMPVARASLLIAAGVPAVHYVTSADDKIDDAKNTAAAVFPNPSPPALSAEVREIADRLNILYAEKKVANQPILINPDDHPDNNLLKAAAKDENAVRVRSVDEKIAVFRESPEYQSAIRNYNELQRIHQENVKTNTQNRKNEQSRLEDQTGVTWLGRRLNSVWPMFPMLLAYGIMGAAVGPSIAKRPSWPLEEKSAEIEHS